MVFILLVDTFATRSEIARVGGSFVKVILAHEDRVSILVYSFLSNSVLVQVFSDVSSERA